MPKNAGVHIGSCRSIQGYPQETDLYEELRIDEPYNQGQQVDDKHSSGSGQMGNAENQCIFQSLGGAVFKLADPGKNIAGSHDRQ